MAVKSLAGLITRTRVNDGTSSLTGMICTSYQLQGKEHSPCVRIEPYHLLISGRKLHYLSLLQSM